MIAIILINLNKFMKKFLFLFALLIILLAGCGQQAAKQQQSEKFSGSIGDLLARNKSVKCELTANAGENVLSGTTYVAANKARSDFQVKVGNNIMTSHMINDGTWMYTWTDEMPAQAIKIKLDTLNSDQFKSEEAKQQTQNPGLSDYQSKLDYNCYNWTEDDSLFVPPTDINFIDYSQFLQQAQDALKNINTNNLPNTDTSSLCGNCDNIPDVNAKASCRQSLGCK